MWRYGTSLFWMVRWEPLGRRLALGLATLSFLSHHPRVGAGFVFLAVWPSLFFLSWPAWIATRYQTRAIWWTPAPPQWLQRQLPDSVSLGPSVWEVHAQDARRWHAPDPHQAARRYRQTYATEVIQVIQTRPDTVALMSSGFNRLTPAEQQAIEAAGGRIWEGPLWPRLLRRYPPWIMRATQRWMFGGVVSTKDRRDPATWVTWAVPARCVSPDKGGN